MPKVYILSLQTKLVNGFSAVSKNVTALWIYQGYNMMIPRMTMFRTKRMPINHIVMVDGDSMKFLCIRHEAKHGRVVGPEAKLTCPQCQKRGWAKYARTPSYEPASIM